MSNNKRKAGTSIFMALVVILMAMVAGSGRAIAQDAGSGPCEGPDADGDGTPDVCDLCPGFDDNLDADADAIPDGCDPCAGGAGSGDANADGLRDWDDYAMMATCLAGPEGGLGDGCECFDRDQDSDVDLFDARGLALGFSPGPGCSIDGVFYAAGQRDAFPNNCRVCLPADSTTEWSFVSAGTVCNAGSGDLCDPPERCDGGVARCPADVFEPDTRVCRRGSGDDCDPDEYCTGVPDEACPEDNVSPQGRTCRDGSGDVCDPAERCTGVAGERCPEDAVAPAELVCNPGSGDPCDLPERCSGTPGEPCPEDVFEPASRVCRRGSGDDCDPDEFCPGIPDTPCPDDFVVPAGRTCRDGSGDICDPTERCTGVAGESCPADEVREAGSICNPGSLDLCDPAERCSGNPGEPCPEDSFEPSTTVCRAGSGDGCDPDELCPGVADQGCPEDVILPDTTVCRGAPGVCDVEELCTGIAGEPCPDDAKLGTDVVCREAVGICDAEEVCDGVRNACPPNALKSSDTVCRAEGVTIDDDGTLYIDGDGLCDRPEYCTGQHVDCPPDQLRLEGALCRGITGVCDSDREFCSGTSKHCPPDVSTYPPNGKRCRIRQGICDVAEYCDASSPAYPDCPEDQFENAGTLCRDLGPSGYPNFQACDTEEFCDGQSATCPDDGGLPADSTCIRSDGSDGQCQDVGQSKLKCVEAGTIADWDACDADFECASGNCGENFDRLMVCLPANMAGFGDACDGRTGVPEGDPQQTSCFDDGTADQLWCCKGSSIADTGETGTCKACCNNNDTSGGTGKGVVGCEYFPTAQGGVGTCCDGRCSDVETDEYNCGGCGNNCYDEITSCMVDVRYCAGDGFCFMETACPDDDFCYDSCLTCGLTGTCDTCQSVASCGTFYTIQTAEDSTLCIECVTDLDCDDGQTCFSGCGDGFGYGSLITCTASGYCAVNVDDCN